MKQYLLTSASLSDASFTLIQSGVKSEYTRLKGSRMNSVHTVIVIKNSIKRNFLSIHPVNNRDLMRDVVKISKNSFRV